MAELAGIESELVAIGAWDDLAAAAARHGVVVSITFTPVDDEDEGPPELPGPAHIP